MLSKRSVLGLFTDENVVADAMDALSEAGYAQNTEYEVLTGTPYPEGTFGEAEPVHKLFRWPLIGAACGFVVALILTAGTQLAYPLVTGGKPILGIPPMTIIIYEGSMLGAIIFTVIGILFESRLPNPMMGLYDPRITEGYIGVLVDCPSERIGATVALLQQAGAEEVKQA